MKSHTYVRLAGGYHLPVLVASLITALCLSGSMYATPGVGPGTRAFITRCYGYPTEADFQQMADARFTLAIKDGDISNPNNNSFMLGYMPSFCAMAANVGINTGIWQGGKALASYAESPRVSRSGAVSIYASPVSASGWYALGTTLVQWASLSLTHPNHKLVVLDYETYELAFDEEANESYDDTAFVGFLQSIGRPIPNPLPAYSARYSYLDQRGLVDQYIDYQCDIVLQQMQSIRQRVDAVNPNFQIGVYSWGRLSTAIKVGLATQAAPVVEMDRAYYRAPYPDRVGLKESLIYVSQQSRATRQLSYPCVFLAGHWAQAPGPVDQYEFLVRQSFNSAAYGDGYWIWTDYYPPSNWESMEEWVNAMMGCFQQGNTALVNGDFTWASRQPDNVPNPNATTPINIITFTGQKATSWDPVTGAKVWEAQTQELPTTTSAVGDVDTLAGNETITLNNGLIQTWDPATGSELLRFNAGADQIRIRLGSFPQLWLKADSIAGLASGQRVSVWPDSSGNGNNAVQSDPDDMPQYYSNVIGNKPVVYFEGGFGYQSAANGDGLTTLNPIAGGDKLTIFLMHYQLYENGERGIFSNMDGSGGFRLFDGKGEHENEYWFSKPGNAFHAGSSLYGAKQILAVRVDGVNTSFWTDGVLNISVPDTTPVGTSASVLKIGKGTGSDMDYWGYMGEVLIYNRALSDAEMNQIGYYLEEKYGLNTAYMAYSSTAYEVQGEVQPEGYTGDLSNVGVSIQFRQGTTTVLAANQILNAAGRFNIGGVPPGIYDVAVKTYAHLQTVLRGVNVVANPTDIGTVTLSSGDVDGDNEVSTTDLSSILVNVGQTGNP